MHHKQFIARAIPRKKNMNFTKNNHRLESTKVKFSIPTYLDNRKQSSSSECQCAFLAVYSGVQPHCANCKSNKIFKTTSKRFSMPTRIRLFAKHSLQLRPCNVRILVIRILVRGRTRMSQLAQNSLHHFGLSLQLLVVAAVVENDQLWDLLVPAQVDDALQAGHRVRPGSPSQCHRRRRFPRLFHRAPRFVPLPGSR